MSDEKINVEFSFDDLAGLYFIASMGLISIIIQNTPDDSPNYKDAVNEWREQFLNVREVGNFDNIVKKVDDIRAILYERLSSDKADGESSE